MHAWSKLHVAGQLVQRSLKLRSKSKGIGRPVEADRVLVVGESRIFFWNPWYQPDLVAVLIQVGQRCPAWGQLPVSPWGREKGVGTDVFDLILGTSVETQSCPILNNNLNGVWVTPSSTMLRQRGHGVVKCVARNQTKRNKKVKAGILR